MAEPSADASGVMRKLVQASATGVAVRAAARARVARTRGRGRRWVMVGRSWLVAAVRG